MDPVCDFQPFLFHLFMIVAIKYMAIISKARIITGFLSANGVA
jgi:hypothetical protein